MEHEVISAEVPEFKVLSADGTETGTAEMIVAVYNNTDKGDDIIRPGAFGASMARKLPKGVWAHDWTVPIAKTLEARELLAGDPLLPENIRDLGGLYVKAAFNLETQRGKEAYSDLKFGTMDEFSIGYVATKETIDQTTGTRELLSVDWYEWSPVLAGMNPYTSLLDIKSASPHAGLRLSDASTALLDEADRIISRFAELYGPDGMRTKEGRALSSANRNKLTEVHSRMQSVQEHAGYAMDACAELLKASDPKKGVTEEQMQAALMQFIGLQARLRQQGLLPH